MRSMLPLNRSDTLNFVRNDADALQYRPFVPSPHSASNDARVTAPSLSKSISFGGSAKTAATYDDDIDFMSNYLKNLPDYNELNKKISNEQKKCADIYDKLKSINTSLQSQSNRLPKSNSFHSICTGASTKPFAMQSISVGQPANDIEAKNKNSLINRNAVTSTPSSSSIIEGVAVGADRFGPTPAYSSSMAAPTTATMSSSTAAVTTKPTMDLNNVSRKPHPLPKSASSSCVNVNMLANDANGSKKCLNDFWSDHLARNNQQKFGWNYNRIMAVQKANKQAPIENAPAAASIGNNNSYKLQKNMSLSQLDKRIRQDLSREELYNMICNSDQSNAQPPQRQPLSKSVSQTSVPSASFAVPVKISRKPSIPTLFKPLCKSTSNTHVFSRNYDTSDEPRETFTPKLLVKSCSSSSVFGHHALPPSSQAPAPANNHNHHFHPNENSTQARILRNNELLKGVAPPQVHPHQTKSFNENAAKPATNDFHQPTKQTAANDFFMKQNVPQPNKVIVNYPPFKSASSVQIPLHGNLPSAFGHPTPPTPLTAAVDNRNCGPCASTAATTNFYHSNAQLVQSKPMYSTTTTTATSVGSKNNNLRQTAVAQPPLKCKNEVNQQNELLKQPTAMATPSNLFPNRMNFNEIDSNRNTKIRPYVSNDTSNTSTFRNGSGGGNGSCSTIAAAVHCPSTGSEQQKYVPAAKPDPLERIPRRMPVQPTAVAGAPAPSNGMPAAKKLPHSFSSSCVSDLLRANASTATTIPSHSNAVRPPNIPSQPHPNNFTAQTLLYSRLYPNINFSPAKPLHNNHNATVTQPHAIEGQPQHLPRTNGQQTQPTPMPYKPSTQGYALTQSKSATAISRKDSSWLERHGYEIVDMSTSMHKDEVEARVCVCILFAKLSCLRCARAYPSSCL